MRKTLPLVVFLSVSVLSCDPTAPDHATLIVRNNYDDHTVLRITVGPEPGPGQRQINAEPIPPLGSATYAVEPGCWWFAAWIETEAGAGSQQCLERGETKIMQVGDPR